MKVKAVLLDAGETLITPRRSLSHELAEAMPGDGRPAVDEVRRHFEAVWTERSATLRLGEERYRSVQGGAVQYWREVLQETFRRVGRPITPSHAEDLYRRLCEPASWRVFPEVVETLAALRERGLLLAVASNWDRGLPAILEGLALAGHFDALGVSEAVGHEKPGADFFTEVLRLVGVAPDEAVHVGDRVHDDLEGARGAGLEALLIDRHERFRDAPWVIRSLAELPERIDGERRA